MNRLSAKVSAPRMVITWLISGAKKRAAPDKRLKLQIGGLRFEVFQQPARVVSARHRRPNRCNICKPTVTYFRR